MFQNQQHPSPTVIAYRKRIRSRRPRTPLIAQRYAHLYVGVTRQSVSARVRGGKLATELGDGYPWSRYSRVKVADLDAWIARRERHLPAQDCARSRVPRRRTVTKHRPKKTR